MGTLLAVLGAAAVLVALPAFGALLGGGLWRLMTARRSPKPRLAAARGGLMLVAAAALGGVPKGAASIAEGMNGWSDEDGNGILDPMANGAYDWVDINIGDWFRVAGLLVTTILGLTLVLLRQLRRAEGARVGTRVPWRRGEWPDPWSDHPLNRG